MSQSDVPRFRGPEDDVFKITQDWRDQVIAELNRVNQEIRRLYELQHSSGSELRDCRDNAFQLIQKVEQDGQRRFDERKEVVNGALKSIELSIARYNFETTLARVGRLEEKMALFEAFQNKATMSAWIGYSLIGIALTVLGWFVHKH